MPVIFEHLSHERCRCLSGSMAGVGAVDTASTFALKGTRRVYERPRPFRIEHIALDLTLDHATRSVAGTAELDVARVDESATEIRLDAVGFDLDRVDVADGKGTRWRPAAVVYDGEVLRVPLAERMRRARVRVRYRATPKRGMYFLAPDDAVPERPVQVWTQCQDEDARHFFPCHDKPHIRQTMEVRVAVEPGWFVLSNGELVNRASAHKSGRFHYRMRQAIPSYLFTLVAGSFVAIDGGKVGSVPITYHVPPGRESDVERTFASTPEMIRLFARLTGVDFPWTKYAQIVVSDFIFGGMENTGATTLYEHVLLDERAAIDITSDDLIAHELAHQWFGDLVTCRDWSHAWLNEGFATFFEHLWREHSQGGDEYEQGLRTDLQSYLSEADGRYRRPVVCKDYDAPIDIFDRHLYEKGSLILHALRLELGDDVFWKGVNAYLTQYRGREVETRDLMRCLEAVSGRSLERFFEQAVHRAGHPRVSIEVEHEGGLLVVSVKQSLGSNEQPFAFPLEIDIGEQGGGRPRREVRMVEEASHTFAIGCRERPRYAVIDPRMRIIGSVEVKAPADMLWAQLAEAPTARGKSMAAEALGKRDDPATIRALAEALNRRRDFWGARAAAAAALGNIRSDEAFAELAAAVKTRHPKVRRAVAQALGSFRRPESVRLLATMAREDRSYLVMAAACRALGATREPEAFNVLQERVDVPSWADVVQSAALAGFAKLRDERAVDILRARTRYGVPTRGRRAAVTALAELSPTRKTRELFEDLLEDADPHLRVDVVEALGTIGDVKARPALRRQLARDHDARVRRRIREVLRDMGASGRREVTRLREELDELRRKHEELEARLSRTDAKIDERAPASRSRTAKGRKK